MAERKEIVVPQKYKDRKIYSFSRVNTFATCPHSYYLGYIKKRQGTDNIFAVIGTLMHELIEKLQNREITNDQSVVEFDTKIFEITEILGFKFMSDKVRDNLIQSLTHFLKNYVPINCKRYSNEFLFFTEIENSVLMGYIDIVVEMYDNSIEVYDYKISTKYNKDSLDEHGRQLVTYAIALENEYNIKVNRIKWNMLKYVNIDWKGKTADRHMFVQRNEIVKSLRSEIKKDLRNLGYIEFEIENILVEAEIKNDLSTLPQRIGDKYVITDGYVEYPITEESKQALKDFIRSKVTDIERRDAENEFEWKAIDIDKSNSFYCSQLCSYRNYCKKYQNYAEKNVE